MMRVSWTLMPGYRTEPMVIGRAIRWISRIVGLPRRKPPANYGIGLHSAGPAHNLERIFYAILRLKMGRFEIVATTSVEDAVRASNSRGQSDVGADRRLYAPFNGHEPNSLVEGAQGDSTPRTRRLERFLFIRYLSIERGQGNSLCSERPCWPRPSESATMSSDCSRKKIKRRSASRALRHAPESI